MGLGAQPGQAAMQATFGPCARLQRLEYASSARLRHNTAFVFVFGRPCFLAAWSEGIASVLSRELWWWCVPTVRGVRAERRSRVHQGGGRPTSGPKPRVELRALRDHEPDAKAEAAVYVLSSCVVRHR